MKTTIKLFILSFIGYSTLINAQIQPCQWAQSEGGSLRDLGNSTTTDANGNIFLTGSFESPTITFGTTTLTNNVSINSDIFIVKYSPTGAVLWASSAGGNFEDEGLGVSTDLSGNVFVTGYFNSPTITFGSTTLSNPYGGADFFIVKYSPSGTVLWASSAGGLGISVQSEFGYGLSTDASGNVIATGGFASPNIAFGTTTLTNSSGGNSDIFVVKYSPSGAVLWANSHGGTYSDDGFGISTDLNGNIFVTGGFRSPSIAFGTTTLTCVGGNGGNRDIFVVKYSPSGSVLWANSKGGAANDIGRSVTNDLNGNVFVTGGFSSPNLTFGSTTLNYAGGGSFIFKYSPSGTEIWGNSAGGEGYSLSMDLSGNVFVTGVFSGQTIAFGNTTLINADTNGLSTDLFIAKYSNSGSFLWANSAGDIRYEYGHSISTDPLGNVIVTGGFSSPNMVIGNTTLTNTDNGGNNVDVFISKLCLATVGINEDQTEVIGLNIYPNPFTSQTMISFLKEQTNANIKVLDILGREKFNYSHFQGKQLLIEKGTMEAGIYFVQIIDEKNNVTSRKLVVQ